MDKCYYSHFSLQVLCLFPILDVKSTEEFVNAFLMCVNSGVSGWVVLSNPAVLSTSAGETQEEAC